MKRILFCILLLAILPSGLFAQRFYAGISSGYGFAAGNVILGQNTTYSGSSGVKENVFGSYGSGLTGSVYAGYSFTKIIGFEIGGEYLEGKKYELTNLYPENNYLQKFVFSCSAKSWRVCPSFRFNIGKKRLNYFVKTGIVLGIRTRFHESAVFYYTDGNDVQVNENDAYLNLGLQMAGGLNYRINDHWNIFTALNITGASWSPDKGRLIQSNYHGSSNLEYYPQWYVEYMYVKDPGNIYSYSNPKGIGVREKNDLPMSSIGFGFGIEYRFGSSAEKSI